MVVMNMVFNNGPNVPHKLGAKEPERGIVAVNQDLP
jgi:hypothetical protein